MRPTKPGTGVWITESDYVRTRLRQPSPKNSPCPTVLGILNGPKPEELPGNDTGASHRNGTRVRKTLFHPDIDGLVKSSPRARPKPAAELSDGGPIDVIAQRYRSVAVWHIAGSRPVIWGVFSIGLQSRRAQRKLRTRRKTGPVDAEKVGLDWRCYEACSLRLQLSDDQKDDESGNLL